MLNGAHISILKGFGPSRHKQNEEGKSNKLVEIKQLKQLIIRIVT